MAKGTKKADADQESLPELVEPESEVEAVQPAAAAPDVAVGPRCPACNCAESRCVYTRPIAGRIRRCRECRHCGRRYYTWEAMSTQVPRQVRGQS